MTVPRPLVVSGIAVAAALGAAAFRSAGGRTRAWPRNRRAAVPYRHGARIEKAFTIACPAQDLYACWRDFVNLPSIMPHLEAVEVLDDVRTRWHARGPRGSRVTWDAEIIDDTPGRRIAWRSIGGGIPNAGSVRFSDAPGTGSQVHVEIAWTPPGGPAGAALARLAGGDPALIVENDLRRFKAVVEAGAPALNGTDVTA